MEKRTFNKLREDQAFDSELLQQAKDAMTLLEVIHEQDLNEVLNLITMGRHEISVRLLLPALRETYERQRSTLGGLGVEIPELTADGVTYTCTSRQEGNTKTVVLPESYQIKKATSFLQAANGSWRLTKDGDFEIFGAPQAAKTQEFVRQYAAGIDGALNVTVVAMEAPQPTAVTMTDTEGASWTIAAGAHVTVDSHFNPSEDLPPVPCAILIKVPAGTNVVGADGSLGVINKDHITPAFRTSHITDRLRNMEYLLPDGSRITGRFSWTYP